MDEATPPAPTYSAFISYSHADSAFVKWLHRRLETYRLPRRLRRPGRLQDRLAPLFMDRVELVAAPSLEHSVREAIARAERMVVVCSPDAVASPWVDREIRLFRELHPGRPILAAICSGDPKSSFPAALMADGDPPIAADFGRNADGRRLALLKLVAALAQVNLDQLVQRDAQRQARVMAAVTLAAATGVAVCAVGVFQLVDARTRAAQERSRGEQMLEQMLGKERRRLEAIGRLDLLKDLNENAAHYFQGRSRAQLTADDQALQARLLWAMADDDLKGGDAAAGDTKAREASALTTALLNARPDAPDVVWDQAQSEYWRGFARFRLDDIAGGDAAFETYAALARRLIALGDPRGSLELGYALSSHATLLLEQAHDTARAGPLFAAAQADFEAIARARPDDRDLQLQIEDGDAWLAENQRLSGDLAGALQYRNAQRRLIEALLASDPRDVRPRTALMTNDLAIGRLAAVRGAWREALAYLSRARDEAAALATNDPLDDDRAQQLRAIELFEARTLLSAADARSSAARIASLIGDCAAEARQPAHEELATFCEVEKSRLLRLEGEAAGANALMASVKAGPMLTRQALSERWLIDWREEMRS